MGEIQAEGGEAEKEAKDQTRKHSEMCPRVFLGAILTVFGEIDIADSRLAGYLGDVLDGLCDVLGDFRRFLDGMTSKIHSLPSEGVVLLRHRHTLAQHTRPDETGEAGKKPETNRPDGKKRLTSPRAERNYISILCKHFVDGPVPFSSCCRADVRRARLEYM
jgi:hypothetical protein